MKRTLFTLLARACFFAARVNAYDGDLRRELKWINRGVRCEERADTCPKLTTDWLLRTAKVVGIVAGLVWLFRCGARM